ncbi:carboxylesterase/lipase family protein [Streptomyces sp. NPDC001663]|uniref:carboxylesterase/lipase family protein n=1 Tax=Streptomyces sp. NPDC001663 TaxID=3364597 RepID=UPI0036C99708
MVTPPNDRRPTEGAPSRRTVLGATLVATASAATVLRLGTPAHGLTAADEAGAGRTPVGPVGVETGRLSGTATALPGVTVFRGVPYAATTAGEHRWRPPRPAPTWSGLRAADTFGDACPQGIPPWVTSPPTMSEDCLNLNVWTTTAEPRSRRPVFVWFYGGRFNGGFASDPAFDGAGLARRGLVVVTVNYRTGPLGFLTVPQLTAESGNDSSGNYGLLDQIAALRWVQRNISAFGGDPDRVTIAGQSAGAASVLDLVYAPLARGLFHRAVAESGALGPHDPEIAALASSYRPSLIVAEAQGTAWAAQRGATTLAEMRALTVAQVLTDDNQNDSSVSSPVNGSPPLFRPVLDGYVLARSYGDSLESGLHNDVPVLTGNNKDESGASSTPATTLAAFRDLAARKYGSMAEEFLSLYPAADDTEAGEQANASIRDGFRVSTSLWATAWARRAKSPVFTYFWTHAPPGAAQIPGMTGAYHGSEMNYVFDNLYATDRPWTAEDRRIAETMSSYIVSFATHGDPNRAGLPHWAPARPDQFSTMELGDHWRRIPDAGAGKTDFFRRYYPTQPTW